MVQSKDRGRLNRQENKTLTHAVHETHFRSNDTETESKEMEKMFHENGKEQTNKKLG